MSFELTESYPLKPEVTVPAHDMSGGLRRHFPSCYDARGNYIEMAKPLPWWPCAVLGAIVWVIAAVWL